LFLTKRKPKHVIRGTGDQAVDSEGRFMMLIFDDIAVVNTYAPTLGLDLSGGKKKTEFWERAQAAHKREMQHHQIPTIWVGDMNVAPQPWDVDSVGIRQQLRGSRVYKKLGSELPGSSSREREEYRQFRNKLKLKDTFTELETMEEREQPEGRNTQYSHGSRELGIGQRIDHVLTDLPIGPVRGTQTGLRVTKCTVRTDVFVSDHLPLEATVINDTVKQPRQRQTTSTQETGTEWTVGQRVLVDRTALLNMASKSTQSWVPAVITEVTGPLIRV
jgi:exodeoxyribonuclease III